MKFWIIWDDERSTITADPKEVDSERASDAYLTFSKAKADLLETLQDKLIDYRLAVKHAKGLRKSQFKGES